MRCMSVCVFFLGTGGGVPTPKRGLPAILILREGEQILFDCGEGTQRQMLVADCGFHRKMKIFITHMHGDHVLGLPGLLQTMALLGREKKLEIYGPPGIRDFLECIQKTVQFVLTFEVQTHEIGKAGVVCEEEEYFVQAGWAEHAVPSLAYAFVERARPGRFHPEKAKALGVPEGPLWGRLQRGQKVRLPDGQIVKPEQVVESPRKGRRIVYSGDTKPFKNLVKLAKGADLLIHDATLDDELHERAKEYGHSTPCQAAETARKARVKGLVLTHISARYEKANVLLKQAKRIFPNTIVAKDFMKMEIPLLEA